MLQSLKSIFTESQRINEISEEEQQRIFYQLASCFSTVPLLGTKNAHPKAPKCKDWQIGCTQKQVMDDFNTDMIALCCGPANGFLVLDIDYVNKYHDYMEKNKLTIPQTFTVKTGRGYHYYFKYPEDGEYKTRNYHNLGGFELRGLGGYVVAPGSSYPKGSFYQVEDWSPLANPPQWILDLYFQNTGKNLTPKEPFQKQIYLSEELENRIKEGAPIGERSEKSMSVMLSLINKGVPEEEIRAIFAQNPIGDKINEKKEAYFMNELKKAQEFVNQNPPVNTKKEINIVNEAYSIMQNLKYYVDENKEYYALISKTTGNDFVDIDSNSFLGYVNKMLLTTLKKSILLPHFKVALSIVKNDIENSAIPIKRINRFHQENGLLLYDMGTQDNRCIKIIPDRIGVIQQPEFLLIRNKLTLPVEIDTNFKPNGLSHIEQLWDLFDISDSLERHYLNILILSYLFNDIASPILYLHGSYASGKTSLAKAIKNIFDPWEAGASLPKKSEDLKLLLSTAAIGFIDNLSGLNKHVQEDFCLAYSNGFSFARKMYTDSDSIMLRLKCPLILVSVSIPKNLEHDFVSRISFMHIKTRNNFKSEAEITQQLTSLYPKIRIEFVYLASFVLGILNRYRPLNQSRHADFDRLGQAYCDIMGLGFTYYHTILQNRRMVNALSQIENNIILKHFFHIVHENKIILFRASDMLALIKERVDADEYIGNEQLVSKTLLASQNILKDGMVNLMKGNKVYNGQTYLAYVDGTSIGNISTPQDIANAYIAQSSESAQVINEMMG